MEKRARWESEFRDLTVSGIEPAGRRGRVGDPMPDYGAYEDCWKAFEEEEDSPARDGEFVAESEDCGCEGSCEG